MKKTMQRGLCLFLAAILCAGLLPVFGVEAKALSLEERQKALAATAVAYFDKGRPVQYGGITIVDDIIRQDGGKTRSTNHEAPEYATPYETLYSVCSDFANQVYWETFRYDLGGSGGACWTGLLARTPADDPMTVYKYERTEELPEDTAEQTVDNAIHEMCELLQPGDVITVTYPNDSGHTMVYVGDVLGDGVKYIAHCFGAHMNMQEGYDTREYKPGAPDIDPRYGASVWNDNNDGGIRLTPNAEYYLQRSYGKGSEQVINALRPLNVMTEQEYPTRAAALYRVSHPRLCIDRIVEGKTRFLSTFKGETLTLSITLSNASGEAYTVPVTEKVPQGVTLKEASDNAAVDGGTIRWDVTLPAGGKKTLTVQYEVTAERGEQILFTGGSVGDIPSNTIPIAVGGKKLNAEQLKRLSDVRKGLLDDVILAAGANDKTLAETVYKNVLGLDVQFPTLKEVVQNLTEERTFSKDKKARVFKDKQDVAPDDLFAYSMLVPTFHGGRNSWNEWGHERINDPRDMHVEPGDVIVRTPNANVMVATDTLLYVGEGKYLHYNGAEKACEILDEPELVKSLTYSMFYCLRPTLAYDDIQTTAVPVDLPKTHMVFTDVKESDWFYSYVAELVEEGTVKGMTKTTFEPNGKLTFGQALKLITLGMGEKEPIQTGAHWASGYQTLAKEKGWLTSGANLDNPINRRIFCQIAAKAKGLTAQPASNPFTDTKDASVLALYQAGVINGVNATTFAPQETLTRAQIAKIICLLRDV